MKAPAPESHSPFERSLTATEEKSTRPLATSDAVPETPGRPEMDEEDGRETKEEGRLESKVKETEE